MMASDGGDSDGGDAFMPFVKTFVQNIFKGGYDGSSSIFVESLV